MSVTRPRAWLRLPGSSRLLEFSRVRIHVEDPDVVGAEIAYQQKPLVGRKHRAVKMRPLLPFFVWATAVRGEDRDRPFQPFRRDAKRSEGTVVVVRDKCRASGTIDRDVARAGTARRHDVLLCELSARRVTPECGDGTTLAAMWLRIILTFIHCVQRISFWWDREKRRVR